MNKLHPALPPLTPRLQKLPLDERGYPIPFFVSYVNGAPEFRLADPLKVVRCIKERLCWTCGQPLGHYVCFAIGPMCVVNRISGEPPSHQDCVLWSVKGCPFLSKPKMVRREDGLILDNKDNTPGISIDRNPGVTCAWTCAQFRVFPDPEGKPLFHIGEPTSTSWWREGRTATRAEILESFESGLPYLENLCKSPEEKTDLYECRDAALKYLPKT
jgi:hypothetical protein